VTTPRRSVLSSLLSLALPACLAAIPAALAALPSPARAAGLQHLLNVNLDDKEEQLRLPEGVACSDKGALIVADTGNQRLLTYTFKDGRLEGGAPIRMPEVSHPTRLQLDSRGNLLVLDRRQRRIARVDANRRYGGPLELKASGTTRVGVSSFKVDSQDVVYALDVISRRTLVAGLDGKVTREIPWPPGLVEFVDLEPEGGRIYAIDAVAARLWVAEKDAKEFKPVGEGHKERLAFPIYLSQERGMFRVVDQNGHGIALLALDGSFRGRELEMGQTDGKVYYPAQLCSNGVGQLFVADRNNNRVQVFSESR